MALWKSELKMLQLRDLGQEFHNAFEELKASFFRAQGKAEMGKVVLEKMQGLQARTNKDVANGQLTPDEGQRTNKTIQTCINLVKHLADGMATDMVLVRGRLDQQRTIVEHLEQQHQKEAKKLEGIRAAMAQGLVSRETVPGDEAPSPFDAPPENGLRPEGARPGRSLKERRMAEENAEPNSKDKSQYGKEEPKKTNGVEEGVVIEVPPAPERDDKVDHGRPNA